MHNTDETPGPWHKYSEISRRLANLRAKIDQLLSALDEDAEAEEARRANTVSRWVTTIAGNMSVSNRDRLDFEAELEQILSKNEITLPHGND